MNHSVLIIMPTAGLRDARRELPAVLNCLEYQGWPTSAPLGITQRGREVSNKLNPGKTDDWFVPVEALCET